MKKLLFIFFISVFLNGKAFSQYANWSNTQLTLNNGLV